MPHGSFTARHINTNFSRSATWCNVVVTVHKCVEHEAVRKWEVQRTIMTMPHVNIRRDTSKRRGPAPLWQANYRALSATTQGYGAHAHGEVHQNGGGGWWIYPSAPGTWHQQTNPLKMPRVNFIIPAQKSNALTGCLTWTTAFLASEYVSPFHFDHPI